MNVLLMQGEYETAAKLYKRATETRDNDPASYNSTLKTAQKRRRSSSGDTTLETLRISNGTSAKLNKNHVIEAQDDVS